MSPAPIRILLVEDSPSDAALLVDALSDSELGHFELTHVETWAEAVEHQRSQPFDVLLLDLSLPDTSGLATVLRARAEVPLPIIALSGNGNDRVRLGVLRHGVEDYLVKGQSDGPQIARAIRYAVERKRAETELRRARDELELRVQERTGELKQNVEVLVTEISCRKAAEQALRESEERYRTLFESAPVGIAISSARGEVVAFNRHLCAMAGVTAEEARTQPASAFTPSQRRHLIARMRRDGRIVNQEVPFKRKDGSILQCLLQMEQIPVGREKFILTIVQDVTRQKQAEKQMEGVAALLESFATKSSRKEYLKAVVRLLADWSGCRCAGVRLLKHQGRLPFAAHTGFGRQFVKCESELCLGHEDGCACVRVLTGRSQSGDEACSSPNGSLFCNQTSRFSATLGPTPRDCASIACVNAGYESLAHAPIRYRGELLGTLHLADSRPDRFPKETIAFIESIAPLVGEAVHRFKVEGSLEESEARFRSMFERHHSVMLLVKPGTGRMVDANPAAARFYGYSRERLRSMTIDDLVRFPTGLPGARGNELRSGRRSLVLPHHLANGQNRTVEMHSSTIRVNGQALLFSIIHDITERKLLEKQVAQISEAERQRVGQDLHDSLGGKLAGAALLSKALARRLAAHSAADTALAEEVAQAINEAIAQTRAIARGLCPVELSVSGLVGGLAEFAAEIQRQSGIRCRFRADDGLTIPDVFVSLHLFRIVQEAVTNILHHAQARTITISLTIEDRFLLLEISDDGVGLPARSGLVRGMGLRTMKHRAGAIGAQLTLTSRPGGGTVISCRLLADKTMSHQKT